MEKEQKSGFGIVGIILIIAAVAILGGGFLLFFNKSQISSLSLTIGHVDTEIVVTGRNFTPRETTVLFSGYNYTGCITPSHIANNGKELRFIVPNGLRSCGKDGKDGLVTQEIIGVIPGDYKISVRNAWGESNSTVFTVTPPILPTEEAKPVSEEADTSTWKTYRNEQYGFEVRYPEKWTTDASFSSQGGFFYVPFGLLEEVRSKPRIALRVYSEQIDLIKFLRYFTHLGDFKDHGTIDGAPAREITFLTQSSQPAILVAFVANGYGYSVEVTGFSTGEKDVATARQILSTFKFIPLEK